MSYIGGHRQNTEPVGYVVPQFPSLYWPFPVNGYQSYHLYRAGDIWIFTLYWTFIFHASVHIITSSYAVAMQWRSWRVIWIVPLLYILIGGIEAFIAGSIVGGLLGALYTAGYFSMSTWIPFVWGLINTLVVIICSFAIQGGL